MEFGRLLIFTLASSVDYIGLLVLVFSLFRIDYRWYKPQITFVCVFLSYVSFTMREDSLETYAPIVQLILMVVLFWLLFRIQIFYASVMAITGFVIKGLIDGVLFFTALFYVEQIQLFSIEMYMGAIVSGLIALLVARYIRKRNWGFSFVPHNEDAKINYKKRENLLQLIVMVLAVIGFAFSFSSTMFFSNLYSFLLIVSFLFTAMFILLFISRKLDQEGDD